MSIRAVLFDLHGTLIDKGSEEVLLAALRNVVKHLWQEGYALTFDEYYQVWRRQIMKVREHIVRDLQELPPFLQETNQTSLN